jgi:anti-sigma-K factor RskA
MTERLEELVTLEALHMLEVEESRTFAAEIKYAPKTAAFVREIQDVVGELGELVPPQTPPDELRAQILQSIKSQPRGSSASGVGSGDSIKTAARVFFGIGGWAAAACLALLISGLWYRQNKAVSDLNALKLSQSTAVTDLAALRDDKARLEQQLSESQKIAEGFKQEIIALKQTSALASLELASLRSQNKAWLESVAVVVWDNAKQEGMLKLSKMPPATSGHDYQLWVVDSASSAPVSAGVVKISDKGVAVVGFKPATQVTSASKFALSVEKSGGVEKNEGPIVLLSP